MISENLRKSLKFRINSTDILKILSCRGLVMSEEPMGEVTASYWIILYILDMEKFQF